MHSHTDAPRARSTGTPIRAIALTGLIALCAMLAPAAASAIPITGISGDVTNGETHAGIEGARVCLYEEDDTLVKCVPNATSANGEYTVGGLTEGNYRVEFIATGFATQYYDDAPSLEESTTVHVTATEVTPNIDAGLEETGQGTVSGRATSASTGQGAGSVSVCASGGNLDETQCTETNANGEYTISNLRVGSYSIYFSSAATECEEEQGEKIRCELKANLLRQSVSVKVKANQTETANAALQAGGQISGTVTSVSITHPGIGKIEVCATKVSGSDEYDGGECAYTNSSGQYTVSGLESGSYKLEFGGYICSIPKQGERECPEVYVSSYYHGKQTHKTGETVSVTVGSNTSGINETLREAFPSTPASTAAPALTGTAVAGDVLSCSQGTWSHEPTYVVYQWLREGTVISGQTAATYTLQAADLGRSITCSVTAGNGAGAASATSGAVKVAQPLVVSSATASVKGNTALLKLSCTGGGACVGTLKLVVRAPGKHGTSSITIGQAHFSIAADESATVRVHLTSKGASLLAKAAKHRLRVTLSGSGVKGRTLDLKMAKATKHGKK